MDVWTVHQEAMWDISLFGLGLGKAQQWLFKTTLVSICNYFYRTRTEVCNKLGAQSHRKQKKCMYRAYQVYYYGGP